MSEPGGDAPQAIESEFTVDAAHPCLPGHFPGDPLVPGVVLLELAEAALRRQRPQLGPLTELRWAKFLRPVRPGDAVTVRFEPAATAGCLRFVCSVASGVAVRGEMAFAAADSPA